MPVAPSSYRRRVRRGQAIDGPQGFWSSLLERASRAEVVVRLGLCLGAAVLLAVLLRGWSEPSPWHPGSVPPRGVVARVPFEKPDADRTRAAQERAASQVRVVYSQDQAPLVRLRDGLKNRIAEIAPAEGLASVSRSAWLEFAPEAAAALERLPVPAPAAESGPADPPLPPEPPAAQPAAPPDDILSAAEREFERFRGRVGSKEKQLEVDKAIDRAFSDVLGTGVLDTIQHRIDEGSQTEIDVHPLGNPTELSRVQVADVLLGEAKLRLAGRLEEELGEGPFTARVVGWLEPKLAGSLEMNREATTKAKAKAIEATPQQFERYAAGDLLAMPGVPLSAERLELLGLEQAAHAREQTVQHRFGRLAALLGLFVALFTLAGFYVHMHHHEVLDDLGHVATLLGLSVVTVLACTVAAADGWRAELVPLLVFAMTVAIAYDEDLGLLLAAEVALVVVVALGDGLADYVTLVAAAAAVIFWTGRLRSRSRLIYVGLFAALVAMFTQVGSYLLESRPLDRHLLTDAVRTAGWAVLSGFLMTGLLPFIERAFGVLTDLSLLEVGDVAHPLLQELVRRAPGTYNHSINVASIGEAAAEAIGARGLLVRVGAYFHDIGKMLKPAYFVENQGQQPSLHESLAPAMSTLVIVAHVKEGAELARQYRLPQPIVDLITEHHGTTLVEYFYRRATERSQADPNGGDVDEQMYRYPGPKPSTRESAVLMLADAAESASRALADPTPARIQGLVHDLAMKRLLDGQFEDCGLTLEELARIEESLAKSLNAVYHGRVKYPGQRTA
jgi:putative nucleotidyltransferase with HDIG domain